MSYPIATNKDLDLLYSKINSDGKKTILSGQEENDPFLQNKDQDKRRGLTLLITVQGKLVNNFKMLAEQIRVIEPDQYYYPEKDLHVTVLDLISAQEYFVKDDLLIKRSMELSTNAVIGLNSFKIEFQGIIISNSAILAKGYYQQGLVQLRKRLRTEALNYGIVLRERYQNVSAHATFARFKSKLRNSQQLITAVENNQNSVIGFLRVRHLELVIHDWYNSEKEVLGRFNLG